MTPEELETKFNELKEIWLNETLVMSNPNMIFGNSSHQEIIKFGPCVLPLIFKSLQNNEPHFWCNALQTLTGVQPIPREHYGIVREMRQDWINWGKENGYI